jgi:hypothetical protein
VGVEFVINITQYIMNLDNKMQIIIILYIQYINNTSGLYNKFFFYTAVSHETGTFHGGEY